MDPRATRGPDDVPSHCLYSRCEEELTQTPGKRARHYCCDQHLAEVKLAHEDARRVRDEIERVRAQLEQQINQERERAEARVEEVRQGAAARMQTLERELQARSRARSEGAY